MIPKSDNLATQLREQMERGDYKPGDKLPSEPHLSSLHGLSRSTVREAIAGLAAEGWVSRERGRGTIVQAPPKRNPVRTCLLLVRAEGDIYERQSHHLIVRLEEHGVMPMVVNIAQPEPNIAHQQACLRHALNHGVDGIIVDHPACDILLTSPKQAKKLPPTICINGGEYEAKLPGYQILADYRGGARLATEHLQQLGHQHILCVNHRNTWVEPGTALEDAPGVYGDIMRGYREAVGAEQARYLLIRREFMAADEVRDLQAILRSKQRPTAVFAVGDYRAKVVIDIARRLGLRVPDELAVVGYYNTPWTTLVDPPITSVSLQYEAIADLAIEHLFGDAPPASARGSQTVAPELIVRDTCGSYAGGINHQHESQAQ